MFFKMANDLQRSETMCTNLMADVSHELCNSRMVLEENLRAVLNTVVPLDEVEIANLYGQTRHLIFHATNAEATTDLLLNSDRADMESLLSTGHNVKSANTNYP
jgi:hypothetical protein